MCYNKQVLNRKLFDFDAMMIRKQPKNSELLCVILLVMDWHIGVTKRMTRTEKPDLSGFFATLVLSEKLKNWGMTLQYLGSFGGFELPQRQFLYHS